MPKQKTHKASAKRLKRTASGKLRRAGVGRGHLLTNKSTKRKRNLRGGAQVAKADMKRVQHLIP